jgi:hypothetical protein
MNPAPPNADTNPFACCMRASGAGFQYPCACPGVQVSAKLYYAPDGAAMLGWYEFDALSSPPVLYLEASGSGGWTYTFHDPSHPADDFTIIAAGTGSPIGWNPDGTSLGLADDYTQTDSRSVTSNWSINTLAPGTLVHTPATPVPSGSAVPSTVTDPLIGASGAPNNVTAAAGSKTSFTFSNPGFSSPPNSETSGNYALTLSTPDTEAYAISRQQAFGLTDFGPYDVSSAYANGIYSLCETRTDIAGPAVAFGYRAGTFAIHANTLKPVCGRHRWTALFQSRTAAGDGSGDESLYGAWADDGSVTMTDVFTPTASDGTWVSGDLAFPYASGMQYRLSAIFIEPNP